MGICLIVGGSKCLPGWFGALMQWKLKFKWVFACVKEGVKACQDALGHLSPSKRWFDKVAQIGPKIKCPRVPGWVRGGGGNRNLGNAQIEVPTFWMGLPLVKIPNVVNLGFIVFFIPRLTQAKRCKNGAVSEFSTHPGMSRECGKLKKVTFL